MIRRVLFAATFVAALAGTTALVVAQPPQGIPGMRGGPGPRARAGGGPMGDLGLRGVTLSDAQREQVRAIMEAHKTELDAARIKLREAHTAFAEAVHAASIDEATVRTRSAAVGSAMADQALLSAKVRAEVHALLTTEQLEQLKQRDQQLQPRRRKQ